MGVFAQLIHLCHVLLASRMNNTFQYLKCCNLIYVVFMLFDMCHSPPPPPPPRRVIVETSEIPSIGLIGLIKILNNKHLLYSQY